MKITPYLFHDKDDLISNIYLLEKDKECVIVDPGTIKPSILNYLKNNDLKLIAILLTHGHFDHIRGTEELVNLYDCPVYIGFNDEFFLQDPHLNCSRYASSQDLVINIKPTTVSEGEILRLLGEEIRVIETPYHTDGSVSYYLKDSNCIFTGDSLFKHTVGRDDLPTSAPHKRKASLEKLTSLPELTKIYPGHGGFSSIKEEKALNPFVK